MNTKLYVVALLAPLTIVASSMPDYQRAFQQDLAGRRAEEAKAKAKIASEVSKLGPAEKFKRLMEIAAEHASKAEFQAGVKAFNRAMETKPPEVPVTEEIKDLLRLLKTENQPVDVSFRSDGNTVVMIVGHSFLGSENRIVRLLPGNYEIVGLREGYQEVRVPLQVRAGNPNREIYIACTVPAKQG